MAKTPDIALKEGDAAPAFSGATSGGGTGHPNMQPFAVVNFCISMVGLWPSRQ